MKLLVTDRNTFINEIPQSDVCEHRGKYKLKKMCLILPWNATACSRKQQKKRRKTNLEIEISLYLQSAVTPRLGLASARKHKWISLSHLKFSLD